MNIPTEADWRSEPWCLDIPIAYEHFFGKSLDEAFALFVDNALYYEEDVMFMPTACFRFYINAYMSYILSHSSSGDSDGASCFFGLVECRIKDILSSDSALTARISEVLTRLRDNQALYDADEAIYGSFSKKADACLRMIQNPRNEN
jgi:hypothetical protein